MTGEPRDQAGVGLDVDEGGGGIKGRSPWQLFWRRFRRDRFALAGVIILALITALALAAPLFVRITGHGPNQVFTQVYPEGALDDFGLPIGPNRDFWFGADTAGRDLFVRVLYGAQTSLFVALFATFISLVIGVVGGLLAGYYRGKVDTFVSRIIDIVLAMPVLLLALGLVAVCGTAQGCLGGLWGLLRPGRLLVGLIIGLFSWPYIARIVRGQVLSLREKEFVEAARSLGARDTRIVFREVLPNVVAPIIVYSTLIIPNNVLFEAGLSFLGIGVPPGTPSWGRMLSEGGEIFTTAWWMMFFPGVFLFLTTLAFNLMGDGLRDALDPRMASSRSKTDIEQDADEPEPAAVSSSG